MPKKPSAFEIYKLLPKKNCKECGEATCMVFATKLLALERKIEECPLLEEPMFKKNAEKLADLLEPFSGEVGLSGVNINADLCTGCGNCVHCCPANNKYHPEIGQGQGVLDEEKTTYKIVDGKVKICNLNICKRVEEKTACSVCETFCYSKALQIIG
ncbi:MAG: (Fe-S)-binding protein [Candidatus Helarchaeota archaeon]